MKELIYLTKSQIMAMHETLINEFGGIQGLRDQGLLESALAQPRMSAFSEDLYPNAYIKAAVYAFSLSENQPFLDGNKRIAVSAMAVFLMTNSYELTCSQLELYESIMDMANKKITKEKLATWLEKNCISLKTKSN